MNNLLEAKNLSFKYHSNYLFKNLSFEIQPEERVALTAPSGAGKSTLALILSGHLSPLEGRVFLEGEDITNRPKRKVFLVHQDDDLFPWLKVKEQILFANKNCDTRKILSFLKLEGEENKYPCQLSGGMKKRLALGRALAVNPRLIILDEPFGFLDQELKNELLEDLRRIALEQKMSLLLISHNTYEVESFCQREIKLFES